MLFNSITFLFFFFIVFILFYIVPQKIKWIVLLISSFIFYMAWNPILIVLMLISMFANYFISLLIFRTKIIKKAKMFLYISFIINFGLLFIFKYSVFINESIIYIFKQIGFLYYPPEFSIILPMGISFYTFQSASYTIDVYRKEYEPERNFFKFSLFISFFPQLVAGPIERADNLMPQLFTDKKFSLANLSMGLKFILFGFFKKVVIADRLAVAVNYIYNSPTEFEGLALIITTILFGIQIYCDFSGYSDIAIGCAKILDIDLMENFKTPYFSKSIKEFWSRWHISLSTWFKDYVYIPLGGNRKSILRNKLNIFLTFLISGLWHGANWTYLIWGGLHGVFQIVENSTQNIIKKLLPNSINKKSYLLSFLQTVFCFGLVCFAWIFFRSNTVLDSFYIVSHLTDGIKNIVNRKYLFDVFSNFGLNLFELYSVSFAIIVLTVTEYFSRKKNIHYLLNEKLSIYRFLFYILIMVLIISLGVFHNAGQFIYFQF